MGLKGNIIRAYFKSRAPGIFREMDTALQAQAKLLNGLIDSAKDTAFGKEHRFSDIKSKSDFKKQVPVRDYDGMKPWFDRTLSGEQFVVWPNKIEWFAKSSGTTSDRSKYVPVSKATLRTAHYKGAFDVMSMYCHNRPDTHIFDGKTVILGGSQQQHQPGLPIRSGDISAVMIYNQPFLADLLRTPAKPITLMADFEAKLDITSKESAAEHVTAMAGVPTWNIVLLQMILTNTGKAHVGEVWPDMELYIHGGVNFEPYRETFRRLIPLPGMEYLQTYNASEGFFAYQDRLGADDMLLATHHGIYYEFIPSAQFQAENPETLDLSEVEVGQQYALVITTNSGLWRYKIGDTVQITSMRPFRIKVTGRTKSFINAFGEEVIVDQSDRAITSAAMKCHAIIRDYTVAPIYLGAEEKGAHEWLIEFEQAPEHPEQFAEVLDRELQALNSDYEAKRSKDLALTAPKVHVARQGLFLQWMRDHNKVGAQNKVPRLSNDRHFLDSLLQYQYPPQPLSEI
jgi:hypothetical protein